MCENDFYSHHRFFIAEPLTLITCFVMLHVNQLSVSDDADSRSCGNLWHISTIKYLKVLLNRWKGKPSWSIACARKQQPRFYWSRSLVVMNDATPLAQCNCHAVIFSKQPPETYWTVPFVEMSQKQIMFITEMTMPSQKESVINRSWKCYGCFC